MTESPNRKPEPRTLLWALVAFGLFVLFCFCGFVAYELNISRNLHAQVQAKLDALRTAGYPTTGADLRKQFTPLADAENSVLIYEQARSVFIAPDHDNEAMSLALNGSDIEDFAAIKPEIKSMIAAYMASNQPAFALIRRATQMKQGSYLIALPDDLAQAKTRRLTESKELSNVLALQAKVLANDGNAPEAVLFLKDNLGLARSLLDHPYPIGHLLHDSVMFVSINALEQVLNRSRLTDAQMQEMSQDLKNAMGPDWVEQAIVNERCYGIYAYNELQTLAGKSVVVGNVPKFSSLWFRLRLDKDMLLYLDQIDQFVSAAKLPYPQRLIAARHYENTSKRDTVKQRGIILPVIPSHSFLFAHARCDTRLRSAQTVLAVERYRLAHQDSLPQTLQELVPAYLPAVPLDPFDGRPLRYIKLPHGYRVYSVSEDGVDNGGNPSGTVDDSKPRDITFTIIR